MIDLHCHVLPGLDDGAASLADSLAIARVLVAEGVTVVAATPHVRSDYPVTPARMESALEIVRAAVADEHIPIEILPGGEVDLDALESMDEASVRRFALAGNPRFLLVEFPYVGWPLTLAERLIGLLESGITPVLAHPERNADVQAAPHRLAPLVGEGVLIQVTASSLTGTWGRSSNRAARELIDGRLAHLLATDTHRPSARAQALGAASRALKDPNLATWLTLDVPAAIVRGSDLPPRPVARRRRLLRRR